MNYQQEIIARAKELLGSLPYVNFATATRTGVPWNSPIYVVWTPVLSCYWSSWIHAEHSKNIRENSNVFMTIYDSTRARGTNNLRCLYLQGEAVELSDLSEISAAAKLLYPGESLDSEAVFSGDSVKRIYKATPLAAWLNAKSEREVSPETVKMRVEVSLSELRAEFLDQ